MTKEQERIYNFGKEVLEYLQNNISTDMLETDIGYAEIAVKYELMEYVAYNPEIHTDINIFGIEEGDMFYYWGKNFEES